MAKVILDAGHGGNDLGMVNDHRYEKNDTLDLAMAVGELLKKNGVEVVYTRDRDIYMSPLNRVMKANSENADLFVTIHRNHSPISGELEGVRGCLGERGGVQEDAATKILLGMEKLGFRNAGITELTELIDLTDTKMPSLLLDIGYINSDSDNEIFDKKFDEIAQVIASGIMEVLGVEEEKMNTEEVLPSMNKDALCTNQNCRDFPVRIDETSEHTNRHYMVQVGLFRQYNNAFQMQYRILQSGYQADIVNQGDFYAVHVGDFQDMDDAVDFERVLRRAGYNTLLVSVEE